MLRGDQQSRGRAGLRTRPRESSAPPITSREFDTWWRQHEVRAQRAEHKLIRTLGGRIFRYDPRLRMVLYVPVEDGS